MVSVGDGALPEMRQVECDDEFWQAYDAFPRPDEYKGPWLDELTDLLTKDFHARFYVEIAAVVPLLLCFAISLSRRIDSFGVKIFCWNCCLINGAFAAYVTVRYVAWKFVFNFDDTCYYYMGEPQYGAGTNSFLQTS